MNFFFLMRLSPALAVFCRLCALTLMCPCVNMIVVHAARVHSRAHVPLTHLPSLSLEHRTITTTIWEHVNEVEKHEKSSGLPVSRKHTPTITTIVPSGQSKQNVMW